MFQPSHDTKDSNKKDTEGLLSSMSSLKNYFTSTDTKSLKAAPNAIFPKRDSTFPNAFSDVVCLQDHRDHNYKTHDIHESTTDSHHLGIPQLLERLKTCEIHRPLAELQRTTETQSALIQALLKENNFLKKQLEHFNHIQVENQRLHERLQNLSASPEKAAPKYTSPTFNHVIPQDIHYMCYHAVGPGEFCGADNALLSAVSNRLLEQHIHLTVQPWSLGCPSVILFCLRQSRVGTDVNDALKKVKGVPNIVLVVLEHKASHITKSLPTEKLLSPETLKNAAIVVDASFWSPQGLYSCEENDRAVSILTNHISSLSKS